MESVYGFHWSRQTKTRNYFQIQLFIQSAVINPVTSVRTLHAFTPSPLLGPTHHAVALLTALAYDRHEHRRLALMPQRTAMPIHIPSGNDTEKQQNSLSSCTVSKDGRPPQRTFCSGASHAYEPIHRTSRDSAGSPASLFLPHSCHCCLGMDAEINW